MPSRLPELPIGQSVSGPCVMCFMLYHFRALACATLAKLLAVFGRPFVKRFALCYKTVVRRVVSVCL